MDDDFIRRNFVFEEHIACFYDPRLDNRRKIRDSLCKPFRQIYDFIFLCSINCDAQLDHQHYFRAKNTFDKIKAGGMCELEYVCHKNTNSHFVNISGSGIESFKIRDKPKIEISDDRRSKQTTLPVMMGIQEGDIIFYDYPQRPLDSEEITLDYSFSVKIDLGEDNMWRDKRFTKKPGKRYDSPFGEEKKTYYFYGDPGRVYLRTFDALDRELKTNVLGRWIYPLHERKLNMQGSIYLDRELKNPIYTGNIDSHGSFPFLIEGNNTPLSKSLPRELATA